MSQRLLGTLAVWESDETDNAHFCSPTDSGTKRCNIVITTKKMFTPNGDYYTRAELLAHELGHFVSHIERTRTETQCTRLWKKTVGWIERAVKAKWTAKLDHEKEAWSNAGFMIGVNQSHKESALNTYRLAAKNSGCDLK